MSEFLVYKCKKKYFISVIIYIFLHIQICFIFLNIILHSFMHVLYFYIYSQELSPIKKISNVQKI